MTVLMKLWSNLKGQPLVTKVACLSTYFVLPGAMGAALIYSPPDFLYRKQQPHSSSSSNWIQCSQWHLFA